MMTRDAQVSQNGAQTSAPEAASISALPPQQRAILTAIDQYWRSTGEPCPGRYLARRFKLHHKTVQEHVRKLERRGWLRTPNPPAVPARDPW